MSERQSSEVRRGEIVEAMISVMARHGYAKATINKIAEEAELTPGLLHYHFANKGAILAAVLERLVGEQLAELRAASEPTARGRLEAVMAKLLAPGKSARPERVATWVAITAEAIRQPEIGTQMERALMAFRELLASIIVDGVEEGTFELGEATAEQVAAALVALVQGYYTMGITARAVVPRGSALPMAKKMIEGLVVVDEETAQWARVYAARHGTSVSKIVGEMLQERRLREEGYERAMRSFFSRAPRPLSDEPGEYPTRDDLHER